MRLTDFALGRGGHFRVGRAALTAMAALGPLFLASCASVDPVEPGVTLPGRADFTRIVVLGTSFSAGIRSASLVEASQRSTIASLFARQAQTPAFDIPAVAEPGVPKPMIIDLQQFAPTTQTDDPAQFQSRFTNLGLAHPYNNLAVPGTRVSQVLTTNFFAGNPAEDAFYLYAPFILRPSGVGQPGVSALNQALALNPTFAIVELGINDVAGGVFRGQPGLMTPLQSFMNDYRTVLDALDNPADATRISGMALVNVPAPTSYPYMTTIPWFVVNASGVPVRDPQGNLIPLIGMVEGVARPLPAGSLVTLPALALIRQGYGLPAGMGNGQPLPDSVILDNAPGGELTQANSLISSMNAFIASEAAARGYALVDVYTLLRQGAAHGILVAGVDFTAEYVTGGFFSLDGIHPTALGQGLTANMAINAVNETFGSRIPLADLNQFLGVDMSHGVEPVDTMKWSDLVSAARYDPTASRDVLRFFPPSNN